VLIGGFVNLSELCRGLAQETRVDLVCAGTNGEVTREDVLLAGAIARELRNANCGAFCNDEAEIAADAWRGVAARITEGSALADFLRASRGGRNLVEVGHGDDIPLAAMIDRFDLVPHLDVANWRITV
jgi:2-phosphosulfolactate phosphatase